MSKRMTNQEAIEELRARKEHYEMGEGCEFLVEALEKGIEALENQKIGHWTYIKNSSVNGLKICECSNCNKKTYGSHNYCPNCGAKMEIEE
jgi:hypothetical protein